MAEPVSSILRRSVEHLKEDVPGSYRLLVANLGPLVVELVIGDEVFSIRGGEHIEVSDGSMQAVNVRIATSRAAILDLIDARTELHEAVEAGTVAVHGSLDDVQRAHASLQAYVHAAVRAASVPALLSDLRAGTP
ncbi:hypothetical protein [Mycobacterium sp. EPa45]|uniref:hypothetical protein n=1 Tax=Mycobacterium sp. EPa45 TaxID=1545728 RepID=UPI000641C5AB|nr:hypothetical protein [Mycobacterium sp. EPa45]AKK27204.1 SCP-2 sterol transfer family protein [Mycobacterium sp. EPa45]